MQTDRRLLYARSILSVDGARPPVSRAISPRGGRFEWRQVGPLATFVHHRVEKLGALALILALVPGVLPATASTVTVHSAAAASSNVWGFEEGPYVAALAKLGIGLSMSSVDTQLQGPSHPIGTTPEGFDLGQAQAVAMEIFDATTHGPGSHAFGLVGLMLWLVWWRRRMPSIHF